MFKTKSNGERRIGRQGDDFVVFDREGSAGSGSDEFHGHVRKWNELEPEMKDFLKDNGYVNKKGKWKY